MRALLKFPEGLINPPFRQLVLHDDLDRPFPFSEIARNSSMSMNAPAVSSVAKPVTAVCAVDPQIRGVDNVIDQIGSASAAS